MPATSKAQQRFMGACTTTKGRKKMKGKCPPVSVAKEFARKPSIKPLPNKKTKKKNTVKKRGR